MPPASGDRTIASVILPAPTRTSATATQRSAGHESHDLVDGMLKARPCEVCEQLHLRPAGIGPSIWTWNIRVPGGKSSRAAVALTRVTRPGSITALPAMPLNA
jgi:hypothetical protein